MEATRINIDSRVALLVDDHEDGVWLHMYVANGSMFAVLTKEQAKELIAALEQVIA